VDIARWPGHIIATPWPSAGDLKKALKHMATRQMKLGLFIRQALEPQA
jgi:hypothetical protein